MELSAVQRTIVAVAERAGEGVVGIGHLGGGAGSGIVIGDDRVLTNAHNVWSRTAEVAFADGRRAAAEVAAVDVDEDLAVLAVDTSGIAPISWSEETAALGTPVLALARPGGSSLRTTVGFVSAVERSFRGPRGRRIAGGLEHTAPLLPGSSGGPLLDAAGSLLGINTHRLGSGFYLALPADEALRRRVEAMARGEAPLRRRLGVGVVAAPVARRLRKAVGLPEVDGLLIRLVEEDGAAAAAGITEGDLLVEAAGEPLRTVDDLERVLEALDGGELVLEVVRGTEPRAVSVRFEE